MPFLLAAFLLALITAGAQAKPLPLDEAIGRRTFESFRTPAFVLSPDGEILAYVVNEHPPGYDAYASRATGSRFTEEGTPRHAVGLRIYIVDKNDWNSALLCARETQGSNTWRPSLSPDGSKLAFYADVDGPPQLWLYEVSTNTCRKVSDAAIRARHWGGDEAQWARDNRTVYVPLRPENLSALAARPTEASRAPNDLTKEVDVEMYYGGKERKQAPQSGAGDVAPITQHYIWENNSDLAAIDVETGAMRIIVEAEASPRPSVARISPSGEWLSYLSVFAQDEQNRFGLHDLAFAPASGGSPRVLMEKQRAPNADYYRLTYRWHPSEDRMIYLKDDRLFVVNFDETGPSAPRPLAEKLGVLTDRVLLFTQDGKGALIGTDPVDDGGRRQGAAAAGRPQTLALVPLDGGAPLSVRLDGMFDYAGVVIAAPGRFYQPAAGKILLHATHKETAEAAILEVDMRLGAQKVLWRANGRLLQPVATLQGEIVSIYEDFNTTPNIYRFSSNMRRKTRVTNINPALVDRKAGKVHLFETQMPFHDGALTTVRTAVFTPPGLKPGERPPAVVFIYPDRDHSLEASRYATEGFPLPVAMLTTRGYAVLYPHVDVGPGGEKGNIIQEITDALLPQVYKAADLGLVDVDRLAITGSSFGGFASAAVASQTNLFRAAIPINGPYDLGGNYGHWGKGRGGDAAHVTWLEHNQPRIGDHPWANLRRVIDNSPYYQADKINTPMLIMQGADDRFLPEAQKLFVALRRLDKPVQLAIYKGAGHVLTDWPRAQAIDGAERILDFLDRHVKNASNPKQE